jgi:hypothetical protein
LESLDAEIAVQRISEHLKAVHVVSEDELQIVRDFVGLACHHAEKYYSSVVDYLRLRETKDPFASEPSLRAFMGESGVGKSDILQAIKRLLSNAAPVVLGGEVGTVAIKCCACIQLKRSVRLVDVMNMVAAAIGSEEQFTKVTRGAVLLLRQQLYRSGTSLLLVDELQFVTLSSSAHTTLAKLIYFLQGFGIPVVFALNYSAGHILVDHRPEQDIQRFFNSPSILLPEFPEDDSFVGLIEQYKIALGSVLDGIDPRVHALALHWYTAGKKRLLRELIACAYWVVRNVSRSSGNARAIGIADIKVAYESPRYAAYRHLVERSREQVLRTKAVRKDMVCPLPLPESLAERKKLLVRAALAAESAEAALLASLTPEERMTLAKARAEADATPPKKRPPRRPEITAEVLQRSQRH